LRLGVLAVDLSLAFLCALASWRLIFHRKGAKSTAKAQRRQEKINLIFIFLSHNILLFFASWRLGG